jgi:hypothetical protein
MAAAAAAPAAPSEVVVSAVAPAFGIAVPAPGALVCFSSFSHCLCLLSWLAPVLE